MREEKWRRPQAKVEEFEANEYVAACYTANIQCALPGTSSTEYDDTTANWAGSVSEDQWYWETTEDGTQIPHGRCGITTTMDVNGSSLTGTETNGSVIYNITGWTETDGTGTFPVNWVSYDGKNKTGNCYHHKGRLNVLYQSKEHPNRS